MFKRKCVNCNIKFETNSPQKITCSIACREEHLKIGRKIYRDKPENKKKIKAHHRIYYKLPRILKKEKVRRSTPEYKAKSKIYRARPEVKKRASDLKKTKKYKAHDAENSKKVGDTVEIEETRPISKDKKFKVVA
jgi:ribosomal protein S17